MSIQEQINKALAMKTQAELEHKEKEQPYLQEQQERLAAIQQLDELVCRLYATKLAEKPTPVKLTGVTRVGERWKAQCSPFGTTSGYIGTYDTEKEAAEAVDSYYKSKGKIPKQGFNSVIFAQLNL